MNLDVLCVAFVTLIGAIGSVINRNNKTTLIKGTFQVMLAIGSVALIIIWILHFSMPIDNYF